MSLYNKVIWSEGLFLRPQHFQQQDRYIENWLRWCASAYQPHGWGVAEMSIDRDLLKTGKFALTRCGGLMPDGTRFNIPDETEPPKPIDLSVDVKESGVYLALPVLDARGLDADIQNSANASRRYSVKETQIFDSTNGTETAVPVQVGELHFRLLLETEERSGYQCVQVGKVMQVSSEGIVIIDDDFIPPCTDFTVPPKLVGFVRELEGLLHQRGDSLAGRVSESGRGGTAEIADFLLLQAVNRYEPVITHLSDTTHVHPEDMYRLLVEMAGELATFSAPDKRPQALPPYRHDALNETFEPVMMSLRQSLSMVFERAAISLSLEERGYGIRVAMITDKSLFGSAMFVLAIRADVPADAIQNKFPAQVKIGSVEKIRDMVNRSLPGVPVRPLPVAPRQIPFHAGVTYFELDTASPLWKDLYTSGGVAIHVTGSFPGLEMAFWAIRR